jgi:DNA topoisomerase-1
VINQVKAVKYEKRKLRKKIVDLDPSMKKKMPELKEPESDLDDEWIEAYEQQLDEKEKQKLMEKLDRENEKRLQEGLKPLDSLPEGRKKDPNIDRLLKKFESLKERLVATKSQMIDKVNFYYSLLFYCGLI